MTNPQPIISTQVIVNGNTSSLLVLHSNQVLEIYENFAPVPTYVQQIPKLQALLPHPTKVVLQFEDKSIASAQRLETITEREFMTEYEYYKDQALMNQNDMKLHFFQDMLVINQSIFLLRDNVITVYDSYEKTCEQHLFKTKVVAMGKLRQSQEDEFGYKHLKFRVYAISRQGGISYFEARD